MTDEAIEYNSQR
jgi:hypothetical protein